MSILVKFYGLMNLDFIIMEKQIDIIARNDPKRVRAGSEKHILKTFEVFMYGLKWLTTKS